MRWKYTIDQKRIVKRFLLIPRVVDNEKRWLEFVKIEQKLMIVNGKWKWKDIDWIDE